VNRPLRLGALARPAVLTFLIVPLCGGRPATAQSLESIVPSRLAEVEIERSRSCVATLAQVEGLDTQLDPLAGRSRRLMAIAEAISIEDRSIISELDPSDPVESDVQAWFATDSLLAVRYMQTEDEAIQEQRRMGRESVKLRIGSAISRVQMSADSVIAENQDVLTRSGPCDGAVFVRPAVLEACADVESELCDIVAAPPPDEAFYRFVDTPEEIWELRELRRWTEPMPLQVGPTGLDGARTIGYARVGNVVVTAAFAPVLRSRSEIRPAELFVFEQTNQALALTFDHPDIAFTPGLALLAALPTALADEDRYIVHFGDPSEPEILWSGEAGTGAPLEASLPISAAQVIRLRNGEALALTAVRGDDPVYSIVLSTEGQVDNVGALLRYMAAGLGADLLRIAPPTG
jgi:hypothetical protein